MTIKCTIVICRFDKKTKEPNFRTHTSRLRVRCFRSIFDAEKLIILDAGYCIISHIAESNRSRQHLNVKSVRAYFYFDFNWFAATIWYVQKCQKRITSPSLAHIRQMCVWHKFHWCFDASHFNDVIKAQWSFSRNILANALHLFRTFLWAGASMCASYSLEIIWSLTQLPSNCIWSWIHK